MILPAAQKSKEPSIHFVSLGHIHTGIAQIHTYELYLPVSCTFTEINCPDWNFSLLLSVWENSKKPCKTLEMLAAMDVSQNSQMGFIFLWRVQRCVQTAALPLLMQALSPTEGSAVSELSCWPLPSVMLWLQHLILITFQRGSRSTAGFWSKCFFLQDLDAEIPVNYLGRSALALTARAQDEVGVFLVQVGPAPNYHSLDPVSEATTHSWANDRNTGISGFLSFSLMLLQGFWVLPSRKRKAFMKPQCFLGWEKYFLPYCRLKVFMLLPKIHPKELCTLRLGFEAMHMLLQETGASGLFSIIWSL